MFIDLLLFKFFSLFHLRIVITVMGKLGNGKWWGGGGIGGIPGFALGFWCRGIRICSGDLQLRGINLFYHNSKFNHKRYSH